VKVIAGVFGGRKLKTVASMHTRPTAAKIRGAIFNTLGQYFSSEMTVLDLFAGSGALGIEAISRGCGRCVSVERNRAACRVIKANMDMLDITNQMHLFCGDYQKYLTTEQEAFDLIFIDPPYALQIIEDVLEILFAQQFVKLGGRIIIELSNAIYTQKDLEFLNNYHVRFNRAYDETQIIIIEHIKGEEL